MEYKSPTYWERMQRTLVEEMKALHQARGPSAERAMATAAIVYVSGQIESWARSDALEG